MLTLKYQKDRALQKHRTKVNNIIEVEAKKKEEKQLFPLLFFSSLLVVMLEIESKMDLDIFPPLFYP